MRVIAGKWRGRPLVAPKGDATRPTADRTREALFSMLTSRLGSFEGLAVADLFAGSGALGIEALSRGAGSCLFVEQDRLAVEALRANLARLGTTGDVRAVSVLTLGPATAPVDLMMLDPPYGSGAAAVALDKLNRLGWIGAGTWISVETAANETIDLAGFETATGRTHGKAKITLLRRAA
ncbi:MAG: 16S rRNA (guanine(966)-N(2))-methyltransferase RsmD [Sphingomonas sp.]|uniref:16S rRNA (guanine(966)-N(2))-methyltransferase RsmD n=1 Tax=Sphingomonas sp. TaxID=28214 RepID=UPI000DB30423|nr:16S rRNA (guanine(966)-N(2))-methyltransferase RsmD [Zymomonas sp.]MBA4048309.1 16S rRNA (guanine(966)-N(2))-methyltransferase RsmD [Sphingomonas sp.]MBA4772999.1 16S rRNA (guanine(966)-N(2))-methyltransferase RsmD [Sphingomonas sp.]PZP18490.1 MAG: 16S rRNA (guanine(966)-N(2))-methyltransferase RsmD [Sphingomonas hengshuiensis]